MRTGLAALGAVTALSLFAPTSASAVPITIGFLAEVGRVHSAPFDFGVDRGDVVRGTWTYDSDAVGEALFGGGTQYLTPGPVYGLRIEGTDDWPAFVWEGVRIVIRNDIHMNFSATESRCRSGDRIADVYQAMDFDGHAERWSFMFLNCSARAFSSEDLPTVAPRLGTGFFEFLVGQSEGAVILDFRLIGGPQTLLTFKDVFLVPEPSTPLLMLFACVALLVVVRMRMMHSTHS
jgi:hypothetical protein